MKRPDLPNEHAKRASAAKASTPPKRTTKNAAQPTVDDDPFITEFGAAAVAESASATAEQLIQPEPVAPVATKRAKRTRVKKQAEPDPARQARADIRAARKRRAAELRAERRRFTAGRRRQRWIWFGSAGVIVALFLVVFGVAYSPLMAVRTISVTGTTTLDVAAVQAALAPQLGTPLPLVNQDQIAKELAVFPAVQSFTTESIPPSTLVVRITERTPIGSLKRNGNYDEVDAAGVVLATAPDPIPGVPVLKVVDTAGAPFQTVSSMMLSLPADLRAQASEAGAKTASDAWFQISGGPKVVWGDANDAALKLKVLQILLATSGDSSEINVSAPNSPFTR